MARTSYLNLSGRAASEHLRETREANYEAWVAEERQKMIERENELLDQAVILPGFLEFWQTVPDFGKRSERIGMLEQWLEQQTKPEPEFGSAEWFASVSEMEF